MSCDRCQSMAYVTYPSSMRAAFSSESFHLTMRCSHLVTPLVAVAEVATRNAASKPKRGRETRVDSETRIATKGSRSPAAVRRSLRLQRQPSAQRTKPQAASATQRARQRSLKTRSRCHAIPTPRRHSRTSSIGRCTRRPHASLPACHRSPSPTPTSTGPHTSLSCLASDRAWSKRR